MFLDAIGDAIYQCKTALYLYEDMDLLPDGYSEKRSAYADLLEFLLRDIRDKLEVIQEEMKNCETLK